MYFHTAEKAHLSRVRLDKAYEGGNPCNAANDVQTYGVPAGSGGMFEFVIPEKGTYMLVDHDKLSQIPNGLAIAIVAREAVAAKPGNLTNAAQYKTFLAHLVSHRRGWAKVNSLRTRITDSDSESKTLGMQRNLLTFACVLPEEMVVLI